MLVTPGVLQSRAAGRPGGDERRAFGAGGDVCPGSVPPVPRTDGVSEDDGQEVNT